MPAVPPPDSVARSAPVIEKRIYYHDTDCGRVVYYANYLKYLEEARSEFFRARGLDLAVLAAGGVFFVVARVEIDYLAAARFGELIGVTAAVEEARSSSLLFSQAVLRDGKTLVSARTTLVCVGLSHRPRRLPEEVRAALF